MSAVYRRLARSASLSSVTDETEIHNATPIFSFMTLKRLFGNVFHTMVHSFKSLETCPKELYINFVLKFFESYSYFAISQILVIYLHEEHGISDLEAGTAYGIWGLAITVWGLATAWINDNLGVRRSLMLGFSISTFSTCLLALSSTKLQVYFCLFVTLPLGNAMGIPMLTVGIRRYTTVLNRGFAFGLYYSVMNIAAFVSGIVVDLLNIVLKDGLSLPFAILPHLSGNRLVILTATCTSFTSLLVTYAHLREIRVSEVEVKLPGETAEGEGNLDEHENDRDMTMGDDDLRTIELSEITHGGRSALSSLSPSMLREEYNKLQTMNPLMQGLGQGQGQGSGLVSSMTGLEEGEGHKLSGQGKVDETTTTTTTTTNATALSEMMSPMIRKRTLSALSDGNNNSNMAYLEFEVTPLSSRHPSDASSSTYTPGINLMSVPSSSTSSYLPLGVANISKLTHHNETNNHSTTAPKTKFVLYSRAKDSRSSESLSIAEAGGGCTSDGAHVGMVMRTISEGDEEGINMNNSPCHSSSREEGLHGNSNHTGVGVEQSDYDVHSVDPSMETMATVTATETNTTSHDWSILSMMRTKISPIHTSPSSSLSPSHPIHTSSSSPSLPDDSSSIRSLSRSSSLTHTETESYLPIPKTLYDTTKELFTSPTFWRFTAFTLLLINLKTIFRHLDATLPTYLVRSFGENVPKGTMYSINPFMIMFLTPLVAAMTTQYAHYDMIKYGGYLTAVSPFFVAMDTSIPAAVAMIVFLSFGEAIWSPRTYDYAMSVSPEGREASFSAMAAAPIFMAKVPVGLLSGWLVAKYLPEDGPRDGRTLWLIIGLLTLSSPVGITIFEKWIREPVTTPPPPPPNPLAQSNI